MTADSRFLVTGPTGFIGRRLCEVLTSRGHVVRAAVREPLHESSKEPHSIRLERSLVGEINGKTDWSEALADVHGVVHLAGRAHVIHERHIEPLSAYRQINVAGTLRLAEAAAAAGVKRFVFVSSIKVNGESTEERPFTENDIPIPVDPYGLSKWEAEQGLRQIERETGLDVTIVRPPLVYGPGVKGNFLSLLRLVDSGLPLPLGLCQNRRSFVGLTNLVDLLVQCIGHPDATGRTFLAGDGEDLSTPELLHRMAQACGKRARLLPVPTGMLRFSARLIGRDRFYERLCGSLQVDAGSARRVLGWSPPQTVDAELDSTVQWYRSQSRNR